MQICWMWQKIKPDDDRGFQRFLDNAQYKTSGILRYERVFGEGLVSTGGLGMSLPIWFQFKLEKYKAYVVCILLVTPIFIFLMHFVCCHLVGGTLAG